MTSSLSALIRTAQEVGGSSPLGAEPPIGGGFWTIFIPACLFLGSVLGTYLLYRRFAVGEEEGDR